VRDLPGIIKEILEFLIKEKIYWLIPTILTIVIFWLLISTAGKSSVPVFVYPVV